MNSDNNQYNRFIKSAQNEEVPFSSEQLVHMVEQLPNQQKNTTMLPIIISAAAVCGSALWFSLQKPAESGTAFIPPNQNNQLVTSSTEPQKTVANPPLNISMTRNTRVQQEPLLTEVAPTSNWNPLDIRTENVVMLTSDELAELGVKVTDSSMVIAGEEYFDGKVEGILKMNSTSEKQAIVPTAVTDERGILLSSAKDLLSSIQVSIDSLEKIIPLKELDKSIESLEKLGTQLSKSIRKVIITTDSLQSENVTLSTTPAQNNAIGKDIEEKVERIVKVVTKTVQDTDKMLEDIDILKELELDADTDASHNTAKIMVNIHSEDNKAPEGKFTVTTNNKLMRMQSNKFIAPSNSATWIAIRFRNSETDKHAGTPDLTLWYQPTTEFLQRLPERMRNQIQLELNHKAPQCTFTTLCTQDAGSFALTTVDVQGSTQQIHLQVTSDQQQPVTLELYNSVGQLLSSQPAQLESGMNALHIPFTTQNTGIALVVVRNNQNQRAIDRVWLGR